MDLTERGEGSTLLSREDRGGFEGSRTVTPPGFRDLVLRAQAGDRQAMDDVLAILRPHLEGLARVYADPTRPAQSSADLLQECCLRAWRKIDVFRTAEDDEQTFAMFRAWIGQVLRHLGLNTQRDLRAKGRSPEGRVQRLGPGMEGEGRSGEAGAGPSAERTPSSYVSRAELYRRVHAAIDGLEEPVAAEIIRLRFFEGLTLPQIAEQLGWSVSKVRERYRTAGRNLRKELGEWP